MPVRLTDMPVLVYWGLPATFSHFFFFPPFSLPYLAIQWEQSRSSSMNRFNRPHAVPGWAEVEGRQKVKAKKGEDGHRGSWPALL